MTTYGRPGVYVSERLLPAPIAVVGTANAAGACIGAFAKGPTDITLVTSWYDFVKKFGGYSTSFPATFGVGSFFANGGSELYVRRVLGANSAQAAIPFEVEVNSEDIEIVEFTAKSAGEEGNFIRVEIRATSRSAVADGGFYDVLVFVEPSADPANAVDTNDVLVESFRNVIFTDALSTDYIETVINLASQYITASVTAANVAAAETAEVDLPVGRLALTGGANGDDPVGSNYSSAIADFSSVDRPLVLFAPEIHSVLAGASGEGATAGDVHDSLVAWAQANNSFAVLDTDQALDSSGTANITIDGALDYATGITPASSHAAVYYPNIYISDPVGRSPQALRKIGPAGAVAGLYLFTDRQTGPFKAPAGLRATVRGAVALERPFTSAELDQLNSGTKVDGTVVTPVNALRNIPGAGIVSMGARTLLQDGTANRYVNTRRSLIYLRKRLRDLTEFALFQNNDERLWARIRTIIDVNLTEYWNQGGLRGTTPAQAFYVKCDAENNPDAQIQAGEVHIEVGVALQYPAEFVVITLSQKTSN
jgi:uncharacterized protein